ncbi:MAG: ABC transporter ATP-binding protein [Nitrospirae bacterium]|nr:ABC transporter ATP-binding protein [Nitrospirota bacterium]
MIELAGVEKIYKRGAEEVHALRGIDLVISVAEFVSIVGPSGAGKTSLMHILGCLDLPTRGSVKIGPMRAEHMTEKELVGTRRKKIGFVFQQFYLIPGLSVFDNVRLPAVFSRRPAQKGEIESLLEMVGLQNRTHHLPGQLSGGEMQRVAIARALVNTPEILLADEPTGNLDTENSEKIFGLLKSLHLRGYTVVMVTHNQELAGRADRVVTLKDGRIVKS